MVSKWRLLAVKIMLILMIGALVWRLYDMQIVNGEGYKNLSDQRISANITEKAPRGEITDRNGKVLVTNRKGYSIKLQKTSIQDTEFNAMLLKLFNILDEDGYEMPDTLPITQTSPYSYTFADDAEKEKWFENNKKLTADMSADSVLEYYKKSFNIDENTDEMLSRRLIGVRYAIKQSGFSINSPYVLADDVSATVVSKIKERQEEFDGITVTQDYFREYTSGTMAAHILGRIGKIYTEEYEELSQKGYGMNDLVGKQGIEKICEDYLRGTDGSRNVYYGKDSRLIGDETSIPAVPGDYVVLTIDSNLQKAAEESLERNIKRIAEEGSGKERKGAEANAGAAVVLDINTGDVLALATYPTYDPQNFSEQYNALLEDKAKPLWNRAISGTYTPGSTFKPLTAIAALSTGAVGVNEKITCEGVYKFYEDYQPKCWIWSEQKKTHGSIDVSQAIVNSCNYFFYEAGRRTGINAIDEYAKKFGLNDKTGIELTEEVSGNVSSPDYKKTLFQNAEDKKWVAGDTIQTAIGQSFSAFTPIELANYSATIANGGTRYRTHIIKSVHSSADGKLVYENKPFAEENVEISEDILNAVRQGMRGVTDEGSAKQIFGGYPIEVGGKTGTAQISKKTSNNALFVSFAPFEKPEIAVAVVIEHGYRGANAAYVARDIYDEYFGLNKQTEANNGMENSAENNIISDLLP
ncbi:MAG: penicillin-binding protein 2 [Clostridiales bacterium]|nr:penicillin-binding protein 2 [Clostridiales bacterium]